MPIKNIINHLDDRKKTKLLEIVRFGVVGIIATAVQYVVYIALLNVLGHNVANTLGYIVSFVFNFFASTYFTFKVKASAKRGAGFALSHLVNYGLQMATINFFVFIGVPQKLAPLPMFAVCVPINFVLVRFFLKK